MRAYETFLEIPAELVLPGRFEKLAAFLERSLPPGVVPVRFVVGETSGNTCRCDIGVLEGAPPPGHGDRMSILRFVKRAVAASGQFTAVHIVPTGIGAEIGGQVGDAAPAARLLAAACDRLILHPNVVNAADLNEMPDNSLYVEGSVITRLLMGTLGLQPVRANRMLVVAQESTEARIIGYVINAVNAGRASCGYAIDELVRLKPSFSMEAVFTEAGRAAGRVEHLELLFSVLAERRGQYDAVALSSVITHSRDTAVEYYRGPEDAVNPWGGVEAILTHAVTHSFNVPSAHSPQEISSESWGLGVVHPTMAAEVISAAYLQCVLKGLHRSPRLISDAQAMLHRSVISVADVSCVVMPDRCVGLPTIAALLQGIPVIAVKDASNRSKNDLSRLPWAPGQLLQVDSYLEAAGMISALRSGVALDTLRRPLARVHSPVRSLAEAAE